MKFSCVKEKLTRALGIAERFIGKNITLPVLGNVLLEAREGVVQITATNLENAVEVSVPGKTHHTGTVCVPAKILYLLTQSLPDGKIDLEAKQFHLYVTTPNHRTRINGSPPDEFPLIPQVKKQSLFSIPGDILQTSIERVLPAVATSDFKPEFSGVLFNVSPTTLTLVATDTFRLAEKTAPLIQKPEKGGFAFILPRLVAQEAARAFQTSEEVVVTTSEKLILLEGDGIRIFSHPIEGTFPDYGGIIPKQFETSCFLNRSNLQESVRASGAFASRLSDVTLTFQDQHLHIRAANTEVGEYHTTLPLQVQPIKPEKQVSFNYRYLLDGIHALSEEEIFFGCNTEQNPSLLQNREDNSFRYVLMPIRAT